MVDSKIEVYLSRPRVITKKSITEDFAPEIHTLKRLIDGTILCGFEVEGAKTGLFGGWADLFSIMDGYMKSIDDGETWHFHMWKYGPPQMFPIIQFDDGEILLLGNECRIKHSGDVYALGYRSYDNAKTIDGPVELTDLDRTKENKQLVRELIRDVLMGEEPENIDKHVSGDQFIEHNALRHDGLEYFRAWALAEDRSLIYEEVVLLVGQGNFVATLCEANRASQQLAQVDLFRIEKGKVVEHWGQMDNMSLMQQLGVIPSPGEGEG